MGDAEPVQHVREPPVEREHGPAVVPITLRAQNARLALARRVDADAHAEAAEQRRRGLFGDRAPTGPERPSVPLWVRRRLDHDGPAQERVVEREHLVAAGLGPPQGLELLQHFGVLAFDILIVERVLQ